MARGRTTYRWTPRRVAQLQWYAERGFSMAEAAKMLDTSYGAVLNAAASSGIHFHGPSGAPRMNRNRKIGLMNQKLAKLAAD